MSATSSISSTSLNSPPPSPTKNVVKEIKINPTGIRKLDPQKIELLLFNRKQPNEEPKISLKKLIEAIIYVANNRKKISNQNKKIKYKPIQDNEWIPLKHHNFKILSYSTKIKGERPIAKEHKQHGEKKDQTEVRRRYLSFFFRVQKENRLIFAATEGKTWGILSPYTDYKWPQLFCSHFLNPNQLRKVKRETIFGTERVAEIVYADPQRLCLLNARNCIYTKLVLPFYKIASVYSLKPFRNEKKDESIGDISVTIGIGQIRIHRKTRLDDYPQILDHIEDKILTEPPNAQSSQFEVLDYCQKVNDRYIQGRCQKYVFKRVAEILKEEIACKFSLSHRYIADNLENSKFIIMYKNKKYEFGIYAKITEILKKISEIIPDIRDRSIDSIEDEVKLIKLSYDSKHFSPFIDFLEGELLVGSEYYFRINKWFYKLSGDYMTLVHTDFRESLSKILLKKDDEGALDISWNKKTESENDYNINYNQKDNFIVGDCITPFGIEIFDLLKYTDGTTYIYHVKEGFNQHARDAFDQLINSVEMIYEALHSDSNLNVLDRWHELASKAPDEDATQFRKDLAEKMQSLKLDEFKNLFRENTLVFVYAVLDTHGQEKLFEHEMDLKPAFELKDFEDLITNSKKVQVTADQIFQRLKGCNYLDEKGRLTSTFYSTTQIEFQLDLGLTKTNKDKIYQNLKSQASQFNSTIALLSLRRLRQKIKEFNFEFKICQISRTDYETGSIDLPIFFDQVESLPELPEDREYIIKLQIPLTASDFDGINSQCSGKQIFDVLIKNGYLDSNGMCMKKKIIKKEFNKDFDLSYCVNDKKKTLADTSKRKAFKIIKSYLKNDNNLITEDFEGISLKFSGKEIVDSLCDTFCLSEDEPIIKDAFEGINSQHAFAEWFSLEGFSKKTVKLTIKAKNQILQILNKHNIKEIKLRRAYDTRDNGISALHALNGSIHEDKWAFVSEKGKESNCDDWAKQDFLSKLKEFDFEYFQSHYEEINKETYIFNEIDLELAAKVYHKKVTLLSRVQPRKVFNNDSEECVYIETNSLDQFSRLSVDESKLGSIDIKDFSQHIQTEILNEESTEESVLDQEAFYSCGALKFQKKHDTVGDGACSLHALNGELSKQGKYCFFAKNKGKDNQERAKRDFLNKLGEAIADDDQLMVEIRFGAASLSSDEKLDDQIDSGSELFEEQTITLKELFEGCLYEFIKDNDEWKQEYGELSVNDKEAYLYDCWDEYCKHFIMPKYHLSDAEIKLAGYLYNKEIVLFCGNQVPQKLNIGGAETAYILHEGDEKKGHYSRLDLMNSTESLMSSSD